MGKEIGIIFQPNLIPPIRKDEKLVTRRGAGLKKINENPSKYSVQLIQETGDLYAYFHDRVSGRMINKIKCPYGIPEDILWVRETHALIGTNMYYKADHLGKRYPGNYENWEYPKNVPNKWKPSIHMPRQWCRLFLRVKKITCERLFDITEEDAKLEGFTCYTKDKGVTYKYGIVGHDGMPSEYAGGWNWQDWRLSARDAFFDLIKKIDGYQFVEKNPWVWVIHFERIVS